MFSNPSGRQGVSIFNRRRRPRQAVYASPQSQSLETILIPTEVPDQQLADMVQDFDTGPGNYNFASNSNSKPLAHYSNTSSTRPSQTSQQTRRFSLQKHPNNQLNNENNEPKFESNYFSTRPNSGKFSGQQQAMMDTKASWYNTGNNFPNREQTPTKKPFSFDKNPVKQQQSNLGPKQYSWTNNTMNSPVQAGKAGGTARQPRENERASFSIPQNQYKKIKVETPKVQNEATSGSADTFTLKTVDKSMKFVSSTINGLRKWSEHREQLPLVFEIFATLDSVPTSNNNGTAKLFTVKDSTGGIRCIYWEMDQKLPRMARGQIYRLVGALDRKTGHMQCFTIRQAQPDEQQVAASNVTTCDNVLTKVVSMIAEA